MTSIVCCDFNLSIAKLDCLVQLDGANLVDAVLDHLTVEAVDFAFLSDGYLSEILEHQGNNSFSGRCRDDRTAIADRLGEVWKRPTVIQVEMSDQNAVNHVSEVKIRVSCLSMTHALIADKLLL